MAHQDYKSGIIVFVLILLALKFIVLNHNQHQLFEVSDTHVKFHSNWTRSLNDACCIKSFKQALALQNIQSLDVSFAMSNLNYNDIASIFTYQFKPYKSIKLIFSNCQIGTAGVDHLLSLIPNGVQDLELGFDAIGADSFLGEVLAKRLNNLSSLKKLKISLIMALKGEDKPINEFFRFGRLSPNLESYAIILMGNNLNAKSVEYLKDYLQRVNLKSLELNFYANKLGEEGAKIISEAILSQKALNELTLDLYFNNITETGTQFITQSVASINNDHLKYVNLNFDFNYIKNDGGKSIGKLLPQLKSVESLHIGVASKNFGYLGYKYIIQGLKPLTQLKQLTLRCGINKVGYQGAQITRDLLLKLNKLEYLNIHFLQNYVGDDGIALLSQVIPKLQNLKVLLFNIAFNGAKSFGLVRVLQNLAKVHLDSLYLSLSSNEFIDADVALAKQYFPTIIKNNNEFQFDFVETAISKKMKESLEKIFVHASGKTGNKAEIFVNSIISDQQEKTYAQKAQKRQEAPKEQPQQPKKPEPKHQTKPKAQTKPQNEKPKEQPAKKVESQPQVKPEPLKEEKKQQKLVQKEQPVVKQIVKEEIKIKEQEKAPATETIEKTEVKIEQPKVEEPKTQFVVEQVIEAILQKTIEETKPKVQEDKKKIVQEVKTEEVQEIKVEQVKVEEVKVQEIKVEEIKVEEVKIEQVKVEEIKKVEEAKEQVKVQQVKVEQIKVEQIKVEEVKTEEQPKKEEIKQDKAEPQSIKTEETPKPKNQKKPKSEKKGASKSTKKGKDEL